MIGRTLNFKYPIRNCQCSSERRGSLQLRLSHGVIAALPVAIVAVLASVFLIIQPWDGEEAAVKHEGPGFCNVSVSSVPEDVTVGALAWPNEWNVEKFVLLLIVPLPAEERTVPDPTTPDYIVWNESRIVIDAKTGEVLEEFFNPDRLNDEAQLKTTLETLVVGSPNPGVPAWPRDDVPPSLPKSRPGGPDDPLIYQPPDYGSGMFVSAQHGTPNPGERLIARTCDSSLVFDGTTGKVVADDVTPAEREMFDRFLSEIEYEVEGGGQDEAQS